MANIERGENEPSLVTFFRICVALGLNTHVVLTDIHLPEADRE